MSGGDQARRSVSTTPRTALVSSASVLAAGGMSVYARHLAERLAREEGTAVAIARFRDSSVPFRAYAHRESPGSTTTSGGIDVRIVAPVAAMSPALRVLSHTVDRRSLDRFTTFVIELAFVRELDRAIPLSTEVLHHVGSAWELFGFAALAVARRRGIAFTMSPAIHPGQWGDSALDAKLLGAADVVFAFSAHEVATLERLGVDRHRIHLSPLGPASTDSGNAEHFRQAHGLGRVPIVLFVGRKQAYKGYLALVEAMTIVRSKIPEARLVTIGAGAPIAPNGAAVLDLGAADEHVKADALAACDVYCMPSSGEAFGMAYVEAWSYAKPVVVGPAPAARELVRDGVTGFHADQSPGTIAKALIVILSDARLARRMGAAGRAVQQERYTWEAAWRVHVDGFSAARDRAREELRGGPHASG